MKFREVRGDNIWEWPERDKWDNCVKCGGHPLHCLCGEVVGHITRWTLEELRHAHEVSCLNLTKDFLELLRELEGQE